MGKLIDVAVSHFSSKVVRELHVSEWDTTLYAKNLTLDDKAKFIKRSGDDSTDFLIYAIIFGLMDNQGEPVFDIGDKVKLRSHVCPNLITKLANFVLEIDSSTEEEREKN